MPSLYKYSENRWADLLLSDGSVRIGTIFDFRRSEHKRGIADAAEGVKSIYHGIEYYNSNESSGIDRSAVANLGPFVSKKGGGFSLSNLTLEREFKSPDAYVHCTAHSLSKDVLEQFEGADSCVEIVRPSAFYKHLTEVINKIVPVHYYGLHRIVYSARREAFNGENFGRRPDLIKDPEYELQCEVRAIWMPRSKCKLIAPINIHEKALVKFCRKAELL
ncbi:hypothetical protein [Pseudomonas lactis]|uniref:hypothetical protein n=1 Tax=Pseudomonas lactis TaxID=1615674 RepID=UPI0022CBA0B9|nr:hypothetical protein [Pseudomonas lactis]GLH47620.1 hypothetical protein RS3R2_13010 [Pseudomonas lactis]